MRLSVGARIARPLLRHPRHGELDGGEHVLHEDAVAARGVVDEHVRHRADDLAVWDPW